MDYFTSMLYLLISIPVIYLLLSMSKKGRESNPRKPPPGIPFFGNLFGLGTVPHITLAKLAKTYGLLMSLRLGRLSAVVISSPAMAQEAYIKNGIFIYNCYIIDAVCALNHHEKTVGWVPMGRKWRNLRKVCNSQIFSTSKLGLQYSCLGFKPRSLVSPDLFAGGTDTTATIVEWTMAELLRNPGKMEKAQAELQEIIGKGNPVEESDITRLPYLQAVVKEAFRMHPPVS
ncbi:geraniol 8-hydroxylase-like [Silene latifolia]|uniref:geraniol 8-hydroxylase-like n=1 Tax=Silene latifolia TaxID=37657 RepID=UPI003D77E828